MNDRNRSQQFLAAAALAAVVASSIFLFAPFTLFAGNQDEFSVSLSAILVVYWLPGLLLIVLLGIPALFLRSDGFSRYLAILASLACLVWIQGNILVWDYGVIDGSPIPWLATAWRGVLDTSLWVALLLVAIYAHKKSSRLLVRAAVATFLIQLAATGIGWKSGAGVDLQRSAQIYDEQQHQAMFRFSPDRNVLHIVMDGFQSDVFAAIIRDPANSELAESLSGFTFFEDHMGSFPYTQMTMPLLVSGAVYRNQIPVDEFVDSTMTGATILNTAVDAGYEVDIAAQVSITNVYTKSRHTNSFVIPGDQHVSTQDYAVSEAVKLLDLSLFRVSPHFVKAYIYQDEFWFLKRFARNAAYLRMRYFSELKFLEQVRDNLIVDRPTPVYKLFHLMLSHRPTVGNERCEYDNVKRPGRVAVTLQARCGLLGITRILERMQDLGIYDSSVIVLMADHGAWLAATGYDRNESKSDDLLSAVHAGMAIPTLAIKPPNARGPVAISAAPTTIADVPQTIADLIGADSDLGGTNVYDVPVGSDRTRLFYHYAYGQNSKAPGYLHTMLEYEVTGSPFDAASWRPLRRLRPAGEVELIAQIER